MFVSVARLGVSRVTLICPWGPLSNSLETKWSADPCLYCLLCGAEEGVGNRGEESVVSREIPAVVLVVLHGQPSHAAKGKLPEVQPCVVDHVEYGVADEEHRETEDVNATH